jgi:hypothetical protein
MLCKIWSFHSGDWRMPTFSMWRRVALVRANASEKNHRAKNNVSCN